MKRAFTCRKSIAETANALGWQEQKVFTGGTAGAGHRVALEAAARATFRNARTNWLFWVGLFPYQALDTSRGGHLRLGLNAKTDASGVER